METIDKIFTASINDINTDLKAVCNSIQIIANKVAELNQINQKLIGMLQQNEDKNTFLCKQLTKERKIDKDIISILSIYEEFMPYFETKVPSEISERTFSKYKFIFQNFKDFLQANQLQETYISRIKHEFVDRYYYHLRNIKKVQHNHAVRHIDHLAKVIDYAISRELYHGSNLVRLIKPKRKNVKSANALTPEEIKKVKDFDFGDNKIYDIVRDCFLFQCFTGLSYIDLVNFKSDKIYIENGKEWIKISRGKNQAECVIPYTDEAKKIVDKYKLVNLNTIPIKLVSYDSAIPVVSNAYYNSILKQVGKFCNIKRELMKTHCGRKTFAMVVLNNTENISIETVSKMLRHSSIKTTQNHYADVSTRKVQREMQDFSYSKILNKSDGEKPTYNELMQMFEQEKQIKNHLYYYIMINDLTQNYYTFYQCWANDLNRMERETTTLRSILYVHSFINCS